MKSMMHRTNLRLGATTVLWHLRSTAALTLLVAAISSLVATRVAAFALLPDMSSGSVELDLSRATRWSAEPDPFGFGSGLADGLTVAVAADFADLLGAVSEEDHATVEAAIRRAFAAWETPEMRFDVDFSRVAVQGVDAAVAHGFEIDVFAVPGSHPVFAGATYFGYALVDWRHHDDRLLTNGTRSTGLITLAADVYINIDTVRTLGEFMTPQRRVQALQRLLMHEIGHTLGLGHPIVESNANYDNDLDPLNLLRIDPRDPYRDLMYSEGRSFQAILSNDRRAGLYIFFNELQNDDRGGRDVLYPSLVSCALDCDGNGGTTTAEINSAIEVALGATALDECWRADRDDDGQVGIDELVRAVDSGGCTTAAAKALVPLAPGARSQAVAGTTGVGCD